MRKEVSPKLVALSFGIIVLSFLAAFYVIAWQEPAQAPPGGNVAAPLNVGLQGQAKEGGLILNTGNAATGLIVDKGSVGIGTTPVSSEKLVVDFADFVWGLHFKRGATDLGGLHANSGILSVETGSAGKFYIGGNVGIGTTNPGAKLDVKAPDNSGAGNELRICKNGVCCPIWKDCDGDGRTYGNGDCDESCPTCYVGSDAHIYSPDGKDQDCDGTVDELVDFDGVLFNERTQKNCDTICAENKYNYCISIGNDADGTNGLYWYSQEIIGRWWCINAGGNCANMDPSEIAMNCEGHLTSWTNCRCKWHQFY